MQWFCSRKSSTYFPSSSKSWYSSVNLVQMVRAIVMGNRQREEEDDAGKRSQSPLVPPIDRKESTWMIFFLSCCFGSWSLEVRCADQCQMIRYVKLGFDRRREEEALSHPTVPWAHHYARWRCHLSLGRVCIQHLAPFSPPFQSHAPPSQTSYTCRVFIFILNKSSFQW